jgi:hypothetical protein
MSTEHESKFCYGWNLNSNEKLCDTLFPLINEVFRYHGLCDKNSRFDEDCSPEDALYEFSETLYGFSQEIINKNKPLFPLLSTLDVQYAWDNEGELFAVEVENFDISFDDMRNLLVEMTILMLKLFEYFKVYKAYEQLEQKPTFFHRHNSF